MYELHVRHILTSYTNVKYLLGQIPSNMFLNRTRPSRYMGSCMALWAIVSALTALSKDFTGLLLTRFFLGVTEAPYYPGAVYLLSTFYTRKEVATRIAILYTGNILATAFAGLIAAGIFHGLGDVGGITGWRWLFILQGAVTFVIAIVGFFLLPDFTHNTWWLTQEERDLATNRMAMDTVGNKGETSVWAGFRQAGKDPMVWVFAFMAHMHLAANGKTGLTKHSFSRTTNADRWYRFQELLPHRRTDARFRGDNHPGPDMPALPHRRRCHHRSVLVFRKVQ
jgi:MFS family permease